MPKSVQTRRRKAKPAVTRVTPQTVRSCACGCGESFTPYRPAQRFIADHRFRTYESHACPVCETVHRVKVAR